MKHFDKRSNRIQYDKTLQYMITYKNLYITDDQI